MALPQTSYYPRERTHPHQYPTPKSQKCSKIQPTKNVNTTQNVTYLLVMIPRKRCTCIAAVDVTKPRYRHKASSSSGADGRRIHMFSSVGYWSHYPSFPSFFFPVTCGICLPEAMLWLGNWLSTCVVQGCQWLGQ